MIRFIYENFYGDQRFAYFDCDEEFIDRYYSMEFDESIAFMEDKLISLVDDCFKLKDWEIEE